MGVPRAESRALLQEIYLLDLVLALYGAFVPRLRDPGGRRLIESYLRAESDRRTRIERVLAGRGEGIPPAPRLLFRAAGRVYGGLTSLMGTRVMLRVVLSGSRRASKRACALLGTATSPEIAYLSTLRARNEGTLRDDLLQHLIETRPRAG